MPNQCHHARFDYHILSRTMNSSLCDFIQPPIVSFLSKPKHSPRNPARKIASYMLTLFSYNAMFYEYFVQFCTIGIAETKLEL